MRRAKEQQARTLQEGQEAEATKQRLQQCRLDNAARRQRAQRQALAAYDAKVQDVARAAAAEAAADASRKAQQISGVRGFEATQRAKHAEQQYVPSPGGRGTMRERLVALGRGTEL